MVPRLKIYPKYALWCALDFTAASNIFSFMYSTIRLLLLTVNTFRKARLEFDPYAEYDVDEYFATIDDEDDET